MQLPVTPFGPHVQMGQKLERGTAFAGMGIELSCKLLIGLYPLEGRVSLPYM